jgi:hypothetical protein
MVIFFMPVSVLADTTKEVTTIENEDSLSTTPFEKIKIVTYNPNGGTLNGEDREVVVAGNSPNKAIDPTAPNGYIFSGWTSSIFPSKVYTSSEVNNLSIYEYTTFTANYGFVAKFSSMRK